IKDGKGLYVVRRTKAKSMLIEVCFIDTADANHYLSVGYKAIAKAIVEAIIGQLSTKPSIVTPKVSAFPKTGVVKATSLNVRSGPGVGYSSIGMLENGTKVTMASEKNGWYDIFFGNHGGYVSAEFIK
ncbi:SH3 domain-containing protein, partial [Clostridium tagluense]|uniref:SH3 domain-containing protein n=1 Tax=Clostridium tagluense TaxID=360422 RepID=UPI0011CFBA69